MQLLPIFLHRFYLRHGARGLLHSNFQFDEISDYGEEFFFQVLYISKEGNILAPIRRDLAMNFNS